MTEPQWHEVTLPEGTFYAVLDLSRHSDLLKSVARSNGVKFSSKTGCATKPTEHLLPITKPIDSPSAAFKAA